MGLCIVKFVVWLLIIPVASEGKVTGRATCESIGPGEPARVTCHYREDVVKADVVSAVSLLRDTGGKEEKVVVCHRFLNNGFDCMPKAGYKVNGTISDQMIINIPRAQPEHQGKYYCVLVIQQTEFQMESCDLEYKVGKVTGKATCDSTGLGEPARVTCHYSQNVAEAGDISVVWLLHDTGLKQEKVVECHRYFDKEFDCLRKAGYSIMGTISDLLVINIHNARPEHQGIYSCQIGTQQTTFNYIDSCIMANKVSDDAAVPPREQKNYDHQKEVEGTSYSTAQLITTIVVFVLWAATLVVLIVLLRHRRRRNRRQQDTDAGKLKDETGSFLQAFNNGDGNGPRTMNIVHFVRNPTKDTDLLTGVSTSENVDVVATPPYSSEIAAERTPSVTEDN